MKLKTRIHTYQDELRIKRRKKRRLKLLIFLISFFGLASWFGYLLFFSNIFLVKQVEVRGNEEISKEEILNKVDGYLNKHYLISRFRPRFNILFANSGELEAALSDGFLLAREFKVKKNLFEKKIKVRVEERDEAGVWCAAGGSDCFYFDEGGILFKESPRFSGPLFLVIEDGRGKVFELGDKFDDRVLLEKIIETKNILDQFQVVRYKNFFLPQGSFGEFWFITDEGWAVYLDKEVDLPTQLVALRKFLEEKLSVDKRATLQYIDLKINNRIYFK